MFHVYLDNLEPPVSDVIRSGGAPVNLTGVTLVHFRMREAGQQTLKVDAAATVVDAPNGLVEYDWTGTDLDTAGNYRAWWHVEYGAPGADDQDTPEFDLKVRQHSPHSGDLCTLFDVREAMNLEAVDVTSDDQIQEYITEASEQIINDWSREFVRPIDLEDVDGNVTRRFKISNGYRIDLYPYDIREVVQITMHPESFNLVLRDDEHELRPFVTRDGVYTSIKVTPWRPMVSRAAMQFGQPYVDVKGKWGFASVPRPVKRACIVAVRSWLRRDQHAFAGGPYGNNSDPREVQPVAPGTYSLPYASKKLLQPYARWVGAV